MKLDEFYTVEPDASCWALTYEKVGPEQNDKGDLITSRSTSYHANLKQALTKYLDETIKPSETLQDVLTAISRVEQTIQTRVMNVTWAELAELEKNIAVANAAQRKALQRAEV